MARYTASRILFAVPFLLSAGFPEDLPYPALTIGRLERAPKLDGRIDPQEWSQAAAVTGFGTYIFQSAIPREQQPVFYLGYDDTRLYFAMHSPHAKGTFPLARCKQDDDHGVLFEDHIEVQIATRGRRNAGVSGRGFYKFMVNARGAVSDEWYNNGTPGTEFEWDIGQEVFCHATDEAWQLEMRMPIRALDEWNSLDGKDVVVQLVRTDSCAGIYFAGWVPATWMEWNRFPDVHFRPDAPVFQFLSLGGLMEGNLDLAIELEGRATRPTPVDIRVEFLNAQGQRLFEKSAHYDLARGKRETFRAQQDKLALTERTAKQDAQNNLCRIEAWYVAEERQPDGSVASVKRPLYVISIPAIPMTEEYRRKHIDPWIAGRPQSGEWEMNVAYLPSWNLLRASVDLDFFGVPEPVRRARAVLVSGRNAKGETLGQQRADITHLAGSTILKLPALGDGDYVACIDLLDDAGKAIGQAKEIPFVRRHYPWEGNTLGKDDTVIAPFTPIQSVEGSYGVWARRVRFADHGLPARIQANPYAWQVYRGWENIVGDIALTALIQEKPVGLAAPPGACRILEETPAHIRYRAEATLGPIPAIVDGSLEYDGWNQIQVTLSPAEAIDIEQLYVDVPLGVYPDTLYVQRTDSRRGSYYGGIPAGEGRVWDSRALPPVSGTWGSFAPNVYAGNGDTGLWWFAERADDWQFSADRGALEVYRDKDRRVRLRFNLIAGKTRWSTPVTYEFALLPAPVRPLPDNHRVFQDSFAHDTSGYRYWGDSVDSYSQETDRDWDLFGDTIYGMRQSPPERSYFSGRMHAAALAFRPIVLYGSTWMTGLGMDAFDTYGGEWLGRSNWKPSPETSHSGRPNYAGTKTWTTPRDLTPVGTNWPPSMIDCFIYHHQKLIEKAGVNGTWWDNSSIGLIWEYDSRRDRIITKWNNFTRRQLCKRLNVVGWKARRPPLWIINMHAAELGFSQVMWLVENDWYRRAEHPYFEHMTVDEFRAMARTKTMNLPAKPWLQPPTDLSDPLNHRIWRSTQAMLLLHDIPVDPRLADLLDAKVGYRSASRCRYVPYWRSGDLASIGSPGIYLSAFTDSRENRSVLVLVNSTGQDVSAEGFRVKAARLYDAESGQGIGLVRDSKTGQSQFGEGAPGKIRVPACDMRLLVAE